MDRRSFVAAAVLSLAPAYVRADAPAHARTHSHRFGSAQRDSDHQRRRHRWEHTLDPTERHGHPIRVPLTSTPAAFGPPPAPVAPTTPATAPYDHVVIISLDGLRPDAIALSDTPNLRRLREQGAWAADARTITHSYTLPSHTSMLTGVDTDRHGLVHNNFTPARGFVRTPTIFYLAHDAGFATAMFVSKPKLRHIAVPGSVDVFARPDYVCGPVVAAAASYLEHAGAGITFVHLSEPDEFGHSRGWMTEAYLRAVGDADRCVGTLMSVVQARPDQGRVLVIVTADHGGHGRSHGSERDDDMRIPWLAWGGHVERGTIATTVSTMDTAATALAALGIAVPDGIAGRPVVQALQASPRPVEAPDGTAGREPGDRHIAAVPVPGQ
jgi:hypothetical protein